MRSFTYERAQSVDAALEMLGNDGAVRPLAGGTDLLTLLKQDLLQPERLVDLKRADDLSRGIRQTDAGGLEIGALTTLADIERSPLVHERATALGQAVSLAASPQLRNMATLGGNLLQRPRCWYFRDRHIQCWLKGGSDCPARDGENQLHAIFPADPCVAVHPSDPATALLALDASVRLRGPRGDREIAIEDFLVAPTEARRLETVLADDELVISISVPVGGPGVRSSYVKAMDRKAWAFALVAAAARLQITDGRISDVRISLGGVAIAPHRARAAEAVLDGQPPSDDVIARAAGAADEGAQPLRRNAYKLALVRGLVQQLLTRTVASSRST
jgi:xanthine dehydrogenase YagS FAD-binding subunit